MSTAITLQDMHSLHQPEQDTTALRQRWVSQQTTDPVQTKDDWVDSPQDSTTSDLPLDSPPFTPTNTYWVTPHGLLSQDIKILDLTKDIGIPYTGMTDRYKDEVRKALKDHSATATFTVHCKNWLGTLNTVTDYEGNVTGEWKHPWSSCGEATLSFPDNAVHSSHPIRLTNKRWGGRTESFVVESVPFFWEMESIWYSQSMTLYKVLGTGEYQKKIEVGKYSQKWWGSFVTGGTLVVDEKQLDGLIACMTLMVVLKKKRQRAGERKECM